MRVVFVVVVGCFSGGGGLFLRWWWRRWSWWGFEVGTVCGWELYKGVDVFCLGDEAGVCWGDFFLETTSVSRVHVRRHLLLLALLSCLGV